MDLHYPTIPTQTLTNPICYLKAVTWIWETCWTTTCPDFSWDWYYKVKAFSHAGRGSSGPVTGALVYQVLNTVVIVETCLKKNTQFLSTVCTVCLQWGRSCSSVQIGPSAQHDRLRLRLAGRREGDDGQSSERSSWWYVSPSSSLFREILSLSLSPASIHLLGRCWKS